MKCVLVFIPSEKVEIRQQILRNVSELHLRLD